MVSLLRRLYECMQVYSRVDVSSAPTYVARFIERTLMVLPIDANDRPQPPADATVMLGGDNDWAFNLARQFGLRALTHRMNF